MCGVPLDSQLICGVPLKVRKRRKPTGSPAITRITVSFHLHKQIKLESSYSTPPRISIAAEEQIYQATSEDTTDIVRYTRV